MHTVVLLFLVLCFTLCVYVDGLKIRDKGVCVVATSVQKTRQRAYFVRSTKCRDKRRCAVRKTKIESFKVTQNQTVCCKGWTYNSELDACSPLCSTGCVGGRCVSPEICHCDPPSILDPEKKNVCHHPICNPPCQNGECTVNNTCSCFDGYEKVNETCQPKCSLCDNGSCVAPETCVCLEGYKKSEGECKPVCEGCENGVCSAPNVCECNTGYLRNVTNKVCYKPCPKNCNTCDIHGKCQDGVCGGGSVVEYCCPGWTVKDDGGCKPLCMSGCINGTCIAPETCQCEAPLVLKVNRCIEPPPTCRYPCVNGECTGHDVCTCNNGYIFKNETTCVPECKQSCINSVCIAPDRCDCLNGYKYRSPWECEPVCDECENGRCTAPNNCVCDTGYDKRDGKCEPVCSQPCVNGLCSGPETCDCNVGYKKDEINSYICRPICSQDCVNASCISPNECRCLDGFEKTINNHICKPKCVNCENGVCTSPGVCVCRENYIMSDGVCKPVCTEPCINGHCASPNLCVCKEGYEKNSTHPHHCYKPCLGLCFNGICTSDGECICNPGFALANNTCVAVERLNCSDCGSNCSIDGECWCYDGRPCYHYPLASSSTTSLAGMELTWVLGGCVALLLAVLVSAVILQMWRKRKDYYTKPIETAHNTMGSVVYTVPDTLRTRAYNDTKVENSNENIDEEAEEDYDEDRQTAEQLLANGIVFEHEKL